MAAQSVIALVAQDALSQWNATRVLHWSNLEPGAFGGFEDDKDGAYFDSKVYHPLTYYQGWCDPGVLLIVHMPLRSGSAESPLLVPHVLQQLCWVSRQVDTPCTRRCCSGGYWVDKFEYVNWPYLRPTATVTARRRGQLDGSWQPPVFKRPSWCDDMSRPSLKLHMANRLRRHLHSSSWQACACQ